MSICSDEINLLIQHYLQELGFDHSAFAFGCESKISLNPISQRKVQPGSLVYLIQKGIMYSQMEAAADAALSEPNTQFAHQLNLLRASLRQSAELVDEICSSSRRMKVLSNDQSDPNVFYLNSQSSLVLDGHSSSILCSSWSKDSRYLATGSSDGTVVVWEVETLDNQTCAINYFTTIENEQGQPEVPIDITSVEWAPDDSTLAIGTFCGTLIYFTPADRATSTFLLEEGTGPIVSLHFSPDGTKLLVGISTGTVFIFQNGAISHKWSLGNSLIRCLWLTNETALVGAGNNVLFLSETDDPITKFSSQGKITELVVDQRNASCFVGDSSGLVICFDNAGSIVFNDTLHNGAICSISLTKIPEVIITSGTEGMLKMTNIKNKHISSLEDQGSPIYTLAADSIGKYFACATGMSLEVWKFDDENKAIMYEALSQIAVVNSTKHVVKRITGGGSLQAFLDDFNQSKHDNTYNEFVSNCLSNAREVFQSGTPMQKADMLQEMLFLQMQGVDMSWLDFHISNLMPNDDISIKTMAYTAASSLWEPETPAIMMSINNIKNDLSSSEPLNKILALTLIPQITTPELAATVVSDIAACFNHTRPEIAQMAITSFYQICLKYPDALRAGFATLNVKSKLEEGDVGLQQAVLALMTELCIHNPKNFVNFVPTLYKLLTNAGSPWILIRTLSIFTMILASLEPETAIKLAQRLVQPVAEILETAASASVILEVIRLICDGPLKSPHLIRVAATRAEEFIQNTDPNLRYLGLKSMTSLMKIDQKVIAANGEIITSCLESEDSTCVFLTVDLLHSICNRKNIGDYVLKLLEQIENRPPGYVRDTLVSRIISMCSYNDYERVPDFEWYVNILLEIHGMGIMSKELAQQILTMGLRVESVRNLLVEEMLDVLREPNSSDADFIETAAFILGEYSSTEEQLQEAFELLLGPKIINLSASAQAACIQNAFKLYTKTEDKQMFEANGELLKEKLPLYAASRYTEVQERASMLLALVSIFQVNPDQEAIKSLYSIPLKAVAPTAQTKVPIPNSLDLTTPIVTLEANNSTTFDFIDELSDMNQGLNAPDPTMFMLRKVDPKRSQQNKPNVVVLDGKGEVELSSSKKRRLIPKVDSSSVELLPVEGETNKTSSTTSTNVQQSALSKISITDPLRPNERLPELKPYQQEELLQRQSPRNLAANTSTGALLATGVDYTSYFRQLGMSQGLSIAISDIKPHKGGLEITIITTNSSPIPISALEFVLDDSAPQCSRSEINPNSVGKQVLFYKCDVIQAPKVVKLSILPTGGAGEMLHGRIKLMPSFFLMQAKESDLDEALDKCQKINEYKFDDNIEIRGTITKIQYVVKGTLIKKEIDGKKVIALFSTTEKAEYQVIALLRREQEGFVLEIKASNNEMGKTIFEQIQQVFKE
ncbi:Adaptin N terminal region family protein [Histomonas meleagridis]|uniref:Adaptin N terminal region family protein n=1 Tax=Histomonas meleagridis TaxID=135588 RepID=UPI003559DB12|nr:Adaptin N terminal region family protein [Histomonas meleagridis]KAH0797325.1 Adaptin N terminal region family protein [Histomonas meleagridis]